MNAHVTQTTGLSETRKQEIVARLRERGVPKTCPMCGGGQWTLADGYVKPLVQNQIEYNRVGNVRPSDRFMPMVALVCNQCGFTSQHSVGMLGLLNTQEEKPVVNEVSK